MISGTSERSERVADIISERMVENMVENIYDFYSRGIIGVIVHGHVINTFITQ